MLTVFVYGFNNDVPAEWERWSKKTWPGIESRTTPQSGGGIAGKHGVILFSWPGDSNIGKAFSPLQYPWRVRPAIRAGVELAEYLKKIAEDGNPGLHVQFVGHSLGCRVVLSAIQQLSRKPQTVPVVRVLLMGAAVPEGDCAPRGPWPKKVSDLFSTVWNYEVSTSSDVILHSVNDQILGRKFLAAELVARRLGVESVGSHKAVGRTGGPSRDRWTGEPASCGLRHSDYLSDEDALRQVADLFGTLGYRPLPGRPEDRRFLEEEQLDQRQLASVPRLG